jgi:hypothetical protein
VEAAGARCCLARRDAANHASRRRRGSARQWHRVAISEAVVFLYYFKDFPDFRRRCKVIYPLDEMLPLCLLAVLGGAETFTRFPWPCRDVGIIRVQEALECAQTFVEPSLKHIERPESFGHPEKTLLLCV